MRERIIAGNWKMNGSLAANASLLDGIKAGAAAAKAALVVCVPYPYLAQVAEFLRDSGIAWGAQDVSEFASGAYTGEVSAAMLAEFGCRYVIVGHSERRSLFGDTDQGVARKFAAALGAGLRPIFCVGESLAEREAGATRTVIERQLDAVLELVGAAEMARGVIAYEPVWAIGTGLTATPEQAQEVHGWIRARIAGKDAEAAARVAILYGGSMKPANAGELLAQADIDGGLIGGASLVAKDFLAIAS